MPPSNRRTRSRARRRGTATRAAVAAAAALGVLPGAAARAGDKVYVGPSGLWSNADNWAFGSIPDPGDAVQLVQTGDTSTDVLYDESVAGNVFASLVTDYVGPDAVMSFTQTANPLSVTIEHVGYSGMGVMNLFGGTHTITGAGSNALYVGFKAGSSGTVNLSGATLKITDTAYVGFS